MVYDGFKECDFGCTVGGNLVVGAAAVRRVSERHPDAGDDAAELYECVPDVLVFRAADRGCTGDVWRSSAGGRTPSHPV